MIIAETGTGALLSLDNHLSMVQREDRKRACFLHIMPEKEDVYEAWTVSCALHLTSLLCGCHVTSSHWCSVCQHLYLLCEQLWTIVD
jgi:hypothetical protein